eukprot:TRINITY_DN1182_c0_g7_i3.p1 TRINITY_DN1182_c0_g7~~TRINITY_DN1182_c0_g7_i3.p1  ORF type:complete len:566 (-),score=138.00 TRINITY_DN1182_c0_g7_i3:21-1718(-)
MADNHLEKSRQRSLSVSRVKLQIISKENVKDAKETNLGPNQKEGKEVKEGKDVKELKEHYFQLGAGYGSAPLVTSDSLLTHSPSPSPSPSHSHSHSQSSLVDEEQQVKRSKSSDETSTSLVMKGVQHVRARSSTLGFIFRKDDKEKKKDKEKEKERELNESTEPSSGLLQSSLGISGIGNSNTNVITSCPVCYEDLNPNQSYKVPGCGHAYCDDCWAQYFQVKLGEGQMCVMATCPYPKCGVILPEEGFQKFLKAEAYEKYKEYLLNSFIASHPNICWCPFPGCTKSIWCDRPERAHPVKCSCGFAFCFRCHDFEIGDHTPSNCTEVHKWKAKEKDESENITWLTANTKKCPKCHSHIEKNGGCMHMTCRREAGGCGHEFCWLCRADWIGHSNCNKSEAVVKEEQLAEEKKTELDQYTFYYHRFLSHMNALKIADDQRNRSKEKMSLVIEKFGENVGDLQFLTNATEQLIQNRRILSWSYCYGYYLFKGAQKSLFEYLQQDLENHTNTLSGLYEKSLDEFVDFPVFSKWRNEVMNYTKTSKKFLQNFVEGVHEGSYVDPGLPEKK